MLKIVDTEELLVMFQTNKVQPVSTLTTLSDIILRQQAGDRIVTKLKTTKSGSFLNIYIYDKTSWKYLLTETIPIYM